MQQIERMIPNFYTWILDNQCLFNHERFKPFIATCMEDMNLFDINNQKDLFLYLTVNGYDEELIMSALRVWHCYETILEQESMIINV